jgi:type I restriction enzyme R subunit
MNKKDLSERDICSKFIGPAVKRAGWDGMMQIREEVAFTKGRIIVRGKLVTRGKAKRADYILYYKPNIPIAIIEAKDNNHSVGDGMQQALDYATTLNIPFVFSSNGDGFVFHDRTGASTEKEATLSLDAFPSPNELMVEIPRLENAYSRRRSDCDQDYFEDGSGKGPRYYQTNAINATIEAIAKGQDRILLVMATGTGKTYTAFQIIWRLWKETRCTHRGRTEVRPSQPASQSIQLAGEQGESRSEKRAGPPASREHPGDASISTRRTTAMKRGRRKGNI